MRIAIEIRNNQIVNIASDRDTTLISLNWDKMQTSTISIKTGGVDGLINSTHEKWKAIEAEAKAMEDVPAQQDVADMASPATQDIQPTPSPVQVAPEIVT